MTLDELERLHEAASKAPWHIQSEPWPPSIRTGKDGYEIMRAQSPYFNESYRQEERANGELAVAARNALPKLLEVAKAAKALRATYRVNWTPANENECRQLADALYERKQAEKALDAALAEMEAP